MDGIEASRSQLEVDRIGVYPDRSVGSAPTTHHLPKFNSRLAQVTVEREPAGEGRRCDDDERNQLLPGRTTVRDSEEAPPSGTDSGPKERSAIEHLVRG